MTANLYCHGICGGEFKYEKELSSSTYSSRALWWVAPL